MTTVKEFIEWLKHFPEDTGIKILASRRINNYESYTEYSNLKLANWSKGYGWEFIDYRNNPFIEKKDDLYMKSFLFLGEVE